jgi:hypothetical protein
MDGWRGNIELRGLNVLMVELVALGSSVGKEAKRCARAMGTTGARGQAMGMRVGACQPRQTYIKRLR